MDILFFDKRPMFLFGLMIITGIYIATGESTVTAIIFVLVLIAGAFLGKTKVKYILIAFILGIVFLGYSFFIENSFDNSYSDYNGIKCSINGTVVSIDTVKEKYTLVTVRPRGFLKKKIQVYLMDNEYKLCEEACNFSALKMATMYEYSTENKDDLFWDMKKLQEEGLDCRS